MIVINKGMTNSCVFTLTEKITLTDPYLLLSLYSNQDFTTKTMLLNDDVSFNKIRYNEFIIEETTMEDLTDNKIELELTTYDYTVWQSATSSLSLDDATSIVESGKLTVSGTASYDLSSFIG